MELLYLQFDWILIRYVHFFIVNPYHVLCYDHGWLFSVTTVPFCSSLDFILAILSTTVPFLIGISIPFSESMLLLDVSPLSY